MLCVLHLHSSIPGRHSTGTPGVYPRVGHLTTHNVLPLLCSGCMWKVGLCLPGIFLWLRFCLTAAQQSCRPDGGVIGCSQAERQRLAAIPGMINQNQPEAQEMNDA